MMNKRDANEELLLDEVRLISFGKTLRSSSIDEVLEFFCIIKGDMVVVRLRLLLIQYLPLYNERQKHRHNIRSELTGLAQINGRNAISWKEKFVLDMEYKKTLTFKQDAKIVLQTLLKVFEKDGISLATSEIMGAFEGNGI